MAAIMENRDDEIVQLLKEIRDNHREFAEVWGKTASHQLEVQKAAIKRQKVVLSIARSRAICGSGRIHAQITKLRFTILEIRLTHYRSNALLGHP